MVIMKKSQEEKVRKLVEELKNNADDPKVQEEAKKMKAAIKRFVFKKVSWNDMYLKRIEEDPHRLNLIIKV